MPRPTRANGAVLAAGSSAGLLVLAVLQLALTTDVELPSQGWRGGGMRGALPAIDPVGIDPGLKSSAIFSPTRTASAEGQAQDSPLGGAVLAGAVTVAGRSQAIVQRPDGTIARLPLGGRLNGLRLVALSREGAVFESGAGRLHVAFGAAPAAPVADSENEEPSQ